MVLEDVKMVWMDEIRFDTIEKTVCDGYISPYRCQYPYVTFVEKKDGSVYACGYEVEGEGIVITKSNSHAEPGKRTARKTLKIKKELDNPIDCFLTGRWKPATKEYKGDYPYEWQYWWNFKTNEKMLGRYYNDYEHGATIEPVTKAWFYGWASAVEIAVMSGDKVYSVGWISGIPDEVKKGEKETMAVQEQGMAGAT